jgi:hypothetical protein
MIIVNTTLTFLLRLTMAIASVLAFAQALVFIAVRQLSPFEGLFMMSGSALSAIAFGLLAAEGLYEWPLSIIGMPARGPARVRSGRFFPRQVEA